MHIRHCPRTRPNSRAMFDELRLEALLHPPLKPGHHLNILPLETVWPRIQRFFRFPVAVICGHQRNRSGGGNVRPNFGTRGGFPRDQPVTAAGGRMPRNSKLNVLLMVFNRFS